MKNLGNLLRELRGKESLRDASKRIGISHTYLDTIEKGSDKRSGKPVKPTPETLKLLSVAYKYPYDKLMEVAGYIEYEKDEDDQEKEFEVFKNNPDLKRWHRELPKSSEEDLRKLRKMWEIMKGDKG